MPHVILCSGLQSSELSRLLYFFFIFFNCVIFIFTYLYIYIFIFFCFFFRIYFYYVNYTILRYNIAKCNMLYHFAPYCSILYTSLASLSTNINPETNTCFFQEHRFYRLVLLQLQSPRSRDTLEALVLAQKTRVLEIGHLTAITHSMYSMYSTFTYIWVIYGQRGFTHSIHGAGWFRTAFSVTSDIP